MFPRNIIQIKQEIKQVKEELRHTTDKETETVLSNYLWQLNVLLSEFESHKYKSTVRIIGDPKKHKHFSSGLKEYESEMLDNFMFSKNFHHQYLGDIYYGILLPYSQINVSIITDPTMLSKKNFFELFYQFLLSIHLDGEFEKLLKEGRILQNVDPSNPFLGWTIQNPITKKSKIILNQGENTLNSMSTLIHEFGHAYYMEQVVKDIHSYRVLNTESFYSEVPSRCFERLFIHFLDQYGLYPEETKDLFYEFLSFQLEYLFAAYIESKFPDDILDNSFYKKMKRHELFELVSELFLNKNGLSNFFMDHPAFDVRSDYNYAYGDILSLFLAQAIEEEGFDSPLVKKFSEHSCELFDEKYLIESGFEPEKYIKEHNKQLTIFKKRS